MHEGHRKRFLHSPWVCRDFLPKFPNLKFVADLSHFTTIAETDPNDPDLTRVIEQIAHQTYHVHCRVGYDHGPQVRIHEPRNGYRIWKGSNVGGTRSGTVQQDRGDTFTTFTPEHGPPSYQQTAPHSREPLAHIWDVNHWVALRRKARFESMFGKEHSSGLIPSPSQGYEPLRLLEEGEGIETFLNEFTTTYTYNALNRFHTKKTLHKKQKTNKWFTNHHDGSDGRKTTEISTLIDNCADVHTEESDHDPEDNHSEGQASDLRRGPIGGSF